MICYTSIEQSKHLLDLGLSPASADMYYQLHHTPITGIPAEGCTPCWSLECLLEVLPKDITDEYDTTGCLGMCVSYNSSWGWIVYYSNDDADCQALHEEQGKTLLEAIYNMVVWLLEKGYIKKEA